MKLRLDIGFATALTCAALLSACSSGIEKPYFKTEGVAAPPSNCQIDPRTFGKAEKISDFSEPNGCGIHNAYRVYEVSGITFSQPALVRCEIADTLADWIANTDQSNSS